MNKSYGNGRVQISMDLKELSTHRVFVTCEDLKEKFGFEIRERKTHVTIGIKGHNEVITIYKPYNYGDPLLSPAQINWCAMGSQPVYTARQFAKSLEVAAFIADAIDDLVEEHLPFEDVIRTN